MSKPEVPFPEKVFCGVDVSAESLAAAVLPFHGAVRRRSFSNTAKGHQALIEWLAGLALTARVSLESTGIYSMDLALALDRAETVEVAVLNPKDVHRFAGTLRRSKTDAADAEVLAEYSLRMPFTAWQAPGRARLELRSLSRHLHGLTEEHTRIRNRQHAAHGSRTTASAVAEDLKRELARIGKRILRLRRQAMLLVRADPAMSREHDLLTTIPGIGSVTAVQLLGELILLPGAMTVRQWVAYSGLDPAHRQSGTSIHKPSRISRHGNRHLRRALYMPALVAARRDPHFHAFYQALVARHKAKMQAVIAVARKLLHAVYAVLKTRTTFQGNKLFPCLQLNA